jgi:hypothetical protein
MGRGILTLRHGGVPAAANLRKTLPGNFKTMLKKVYNIIKGRSQFQCDSLSALYQP